MKRKKTLSDAPIRYSTGKASAWVEGYNAVVAALTQPPSARVVVTEAMRRAAFAAASDGLDVSKEGWLNAAVDRALAALADADAGGVITDVQRCESGCGPATTADSDGVPLCDKCAWDIDRELLEEIATLVGFDHDTHEDIVSAVRAALPRTPDADAGGVK